MGHVGHLFPVLILVLADMAGFSWPTSWVRWLKWALRAIQETARELSSAPRLFV